MIAKTEKILLGVLTALTLQANSQVFDFRSEGFTGLITSNVNSIDSKINATFSSSGEADLGASAGAKSGLRNYAGLGRSSYSNGSLAASSFTFDFNQNVTNANFLMEGAWQFSDYKITVNGTGAIDGTNIFANNSTPFTLVGNNTNSILLDINSNSGFEGDFTVSGVFSTITVEQVGNSFGSSSEYDSVVLLSPDSLTVVPEPSSLALFGLSSLFVLTHRRRK